MPEPSDAFDDLWRRQGVGRTPKGSPFGEPPKRPRKGPRMTDAEKRGAKLLVGTIVVCFFLFILFLGGCSGWNNVDGGHVNLVRNGGIFDTKDIREVRPPESGYTVSGLWSEVREYIAGSVTRFYRVSSDPSIGEQSGADFIKVPTKDGVNVEVDANIQFHDNFSDEEGNLVPCECGGKFEYLVERFDTAFGNRSFSSRDGDDHKVYDGNDGWNAFLDTMFRPIVENSFREQIGAINCADLISSCSLVQSTRQTGSTTKITAQDNEENFTRIAENLKTQLEVGTEAALGDDYLTGFHVEVTKVSLPNKVEDAINTAQASFADIAKSRAEKISADYEAEAAERKAAAYRDNPILGYLKAVESLKDSTATIILGEPGTGLTLGK